MGFEPEQVALGAVAALTVGFSRTGLPGVGILVVPLMAAAFGGRLSVGATLPMLIFADLFAVSTYRKHADWGSIRALAPWIVGGMAAGTLALWALGEKKEGRDPLGPIIGGMVLVMLGLQLARERWGKGFAPHTPVGVSVTGMVAGFSTMVSNAAGPVISIYLVAKGISKEWFMGTSAWFYFVFNLTKLPILLALTALNPARPLLTASTLLFNVSMIPMIAVGVVIGRWALPRIPQRLFTHLVLLLAGLAAVRLLFT